MPDTRPVKRFGIASGELLIAGVPLSQLTARVGATPYFAYDRAAMTRRMAELREALGVSVDIGYAVKANPMPAVVQHLVGHVDFLGVASAGEMTTALDAGMPPGFIGFAGPGKTDDELRRAVAAEVLVELESERESRRIAAIGEELGLRPRVALRINPDFAVEGSGIRMGGGPQQFGVDVEQAPALMDQLRELDLPLEGFHVFAGSQNLHAEVLVEAQSRTVDLMLALADKAPEPPTYLNLGGGFGIPYFAKDNALDIARVGEHLRWLADDLLLRALPHARVVIELGRFLVSEAGVYVTRVVDRKASRGKTYLVVDGGIHDHLAALGNVGPLSPRNHQLVIGSRADQPATTTASVVGCSCISLDVLGGDVDLPDASVGDLVVVFHAGAYGHSARPLGFLGHPTPAEVLV
jgi:diaminopimelate decarboxylase